jgi:c-di-GMP-binding flagellar brake protein YcgR
MERFMGTRFFQRVIFRRYIEAITQDGVFSGILENISLGGMFIKTDKNLSIGDQIEINFPINNGITDTNLTAKLSAIRKDDNGIAFKFMDLDPKSFWTLQSFINSEI